MNWQVFWLVLCGAGASCVWLSLFFVLVNRICEGKDGRVSIAAVLSYLCLTFALLAGVLA